MRGRRSRRSRSARGRPVGRRAAGARRARPGWTTLPGFIRSCGSKSALTSPNSATTSSPNIRGSSSPRDWPSPCSPDSEPPYDDDQVGRALHERAGRSRRPRWCRGRTGSGCARSPARSGRRGWARCRTRSRTPRRALGGRAGSRRAARRGTAESSQPSQVSGRCGTWAVAPSPASRTCQSSSSRVGVVEERDVGVVLGLRRARRASRAPCASASSVCRRRTAPSGSRRPSGSSPSASAVHAP